MTGIASEDILRFWFEALEPKQWWSKDAALDALIAERYAPLLASASRCELYGWRATPRGRLAEVIVLDQFSRNIHRGTAQAFAADGMALVLAQEAVSRGLNWALAPPRRTFLYMPYMHSESLAIHEEALRLFSQPGLESNLEFEIQHKQILERFGRYPHRNGALGRISTPEEIAFLSEPGSSF